MKKTGKILAAVSLASLVAGNASADWFGETKHYAWTPFGGLEESHLPGGYYTLFLSKDPLLRKKQQERIGQFIVDQLTGDYDTVTYQFMEITLKDDFGQQILDAQGKLTVLDSKLIINAYEENDGEKWATLGINLDTICNSFLTQERFWFLKLGDYVTIENAFGDVGRTKDLKEKVAQTLAELFGKYAWLNNSEFCTDYIFNQQKSRGPGGPE